MAIKIGTFVFLLFTIIQLSYGLPNRSQPSNNIVGEATNIIATNILKSNIDNEKNFVFSPLGFSTILSVLGEGANQHTINEIGEFLNYPSSDRLRIQSAYKSILDGFQSDNPRLAPQFKTWMYIYRNNTIEKEFEDNIRDNYFVDVRTIDRDYINYDDIGAGSEEHIIEKKQTQKPSNNSKDIPEFETLKKRIDLDDETRRISGDDAEEQKDSSKFDAVVEDKQYVEVPVIKKELSKAKESNVPNVVGDDDDDKNEDLKKNTNNNDVMDVETFLKKNKDSDKLKLNKIKQKSNEPEKIKLPLKKLNDMELMRAIDGHTSTNGGNEFGSIGDVTSVISGNSIVGEKSTSDKTDKGGQIKYETKMILFNGLYYKGSWATPFQQLRFGPEYIFHKSDTEKLNIKMMRSCGYYKIASLNELDSKAISLQYDNERYALVIVLPNQPNGLKQLISKMDAHLLNEIHGLWQEELIDFSLPKFNIESTSGAEKSFARSGLAGIFTSKADFSGISTVQKLHIEELQQHVAVSVDEGHSSENSLTVTNLYASRANEQHPDKTIVVDRPFLFYVYDQIDNVILVSGKILAPPEIFDEPTI